MIADGQAGLLKLAVRLDAFKVIELNCKTDVDVDTQYTATVTFMISEACPLGPTYRHSRIYRMIVLASTGCAACGADLHQSLITKGYQAHFLKDIGVFSAWDKNDNLSATP
jgi:hypothetical protein